MRRRATKVKPDATRAWWRAGVLALAGALAIAGCAQARRHSAAAAGDAGATLRLSPSPAFSNARIAAMLDGRTPDADRYRCEWRRNGMRIEGVTGGELEPSRFRRGDHIAVRVVPRTAGEGAAGWTAETEVHNTAPSVTGVTIVLETGPAGPELRATVECVDLDGDTPRLEYTWFRNGEALDGHEGPSLPVAGLARGDRFVVEVIALDHDATSLPRRSEPFVLENLPPAFTSRPASPGSRDEVFAYQAAAADPDGDALRFALVRGPAGMTVSPQGEVRWTLPAERAGGHAVAIRASDGRGGEALQEFTLRLEPPVAKR